MSHRWQGSGEPEKSVHRPVLVREVVQWLDLQTGLVVVDGTVGAGGHSRHILEHIGPEGTLIGLDRDTAMLARARAHCDRPNCELRQASYAELPEVLSELGIEQVDRVLLDLGLSSDQLAEGERGFSFEAEGPLDLRFDTSQSRPAWQWLAELDEEQITETLQQLGEERFAQQIARALVDTRKSQPVRTARDLVEVVEAAVPGRFQRQSRKHPATRVFQAIRMAVNDELGHLQRILEGGLPQCIRPGGRAVIISFHSLEDRLVKRTFRDQQQWQNLTSKPIRATAAEQRLNPRSRSAKLRAALRK